MVSGQTITAAVVRQRCALAGITLDEDQIEEVAAAMELAIAPLRELDLRAIRLVEPAVHFAAPMSDASQPAAD